MTRPLATLLLLACTMLWGFAFVAQKSAMDSMGPLTFAAARYLLGGLVIMPLALFEHKRKKTPLSPRHWGLVMVLSVVFFLGSWLQQEGLISTTVTNGGFLTGLYVFFVPAIAFIVMRTKPHPVVLICVPLALVGIYYLNGGGLDSFNLGDGIIVFSAVFWACHVLMLGYIARATGLPIYVSAISFLAAGLMALVFALVLEQPNIAALQAGWIQIAYTGILSTAVAFTFQAIGQQYVPSANAAIILSAESLFAALGAAVVLGERLPLVGYFGASVLFIAIVVVETVPAVLEKRRLRVSAAEIMHP
ncbi:DMT family transporter [Devosia rhodophyticola]|uniref:DMT family transporter n=1 Tax=Devosia rhodophyticola TaxID=3026423 RepID=A0ABY7YVC4_9HYPH|nr:DMT family transporter [Devosia rhodophyticola]WDR05137.1 DMT family transporter [Devosia rhodophyticola]